MNRPLATVRPATAADAHTLAALAIQVWLDTYATDGVNDVLGRYVLSTFTPAAFAAWSESPHVALRVAQVGDQLVGYALLQFGAAQPLVPGCDTELRTLYVQSPFQRSGVGSMLLREARSAAHARTGSDGLWLAVYTKNPRAVAFYEKQGLVAMGLTQFMLGGKPHDNHVMATPPR
ncbi:ribosomal protein S18 acetylase RimI-like enzyme [Variovorax boronicumulans]|uniref:Ribosomal protein S18 acetylase RimI-like enzyme n=1 Tax=Variovorax boronicumulans TaxID=436515 RepID=A0AAW8E3S3_9BURK|nr:GNAT family N-acetyltransferase [Variovorax boronicumulans]MDP9881165.1 ribosomal protein S18 acetylase RimI-like enzyme [Variovorax boronicumulans]MDP9926452.1 ribosomal protein S18 acetylase RimI-like enzyme [Variovorax boronicumulans]